MPVAKQIDRPFLFITLALVLLGFFIFISASLGLLARENITFSAIALNQLVSLGIGGALAYAASRTPFRFWNKHALLILGIAIVATLLVFVPGLGFAHGGARRWLSFGAFSFQPAELLKLGFVVYWASWIAIARQKITTITHGVIPLGILLLISAIILALQPDMGTVLVIAMTGIAMYIAAGGSWKHIGGLALAALLALSVLILFKPYIKDRLLTFVDPSRDPQGSGYQIQQSLIAIGSGQWVGRGFGQSIQKFNFLPEPVGDSIFAVYAEEWGFVGAFILIVLFVTFLLRGFKIAGRAPTIFSRTVVVGFSVLIVGQSLINIASMLGVFPLTGMPLIFVSQGGSALMLALAEVGIILNISRESRSVVA